MPLPLPNLDTRRYADLVDDAHALVPRYAPSWTDHNASDPGITLLELLAWLVEQDIYRVNRIPERHRRKFLTLAGVVPAPPRPARAVLSLTAAAETIVPAGSAFLAGSVPFRSTNRVRVVPAALTAVQTWDGAAFADVTAGWRQGLGVPAWGADATGFGGPDPPALLLGFDRSLPRRALSLWLGVDGGGDPEEAALVAAEEAAQADACLPLRPRWSCGAEPPPAPAAPPACDCAEEPASVWELLDDDGWHELPARDATRALLLDGLVEIVPPLDAAAVQVGAVPQPLNWIRCRASGGAPDVAPILTEVVFNAAVVAQRVAARSRLTLAPGADLPPTPLLPGHLAKLTLELDEAGRVTRARRTNASGIPFVRVLDVTADALEAELVVAGSGLGVPELELELGAAPVAGAEIAVWSGEDVWGARIDFDAARPRDRVFTLDAEAGGLRFGDGEHGLAPRAGTTMLAAYDVTLGAAGNVPATAGWVAPDQPDVAVAPRGAATGGADAEDVAHAAARAAEALWAHERLLELAAGEPTLDGRPRPAVVALAAPQRAATTLDFERLALTVPGSRIARARAWAEVDPGAPGLRAPGTVTVVVLGGLPTDRPEPSAALLARVDRHLRRRKTLGTRLVVAGPSYVVVGAHAAVRTFPGADAAATVAAALAALHTFLHPRRWPFGRDVFRAEVLALLDGIPGVDAVTSLELTADGGEAMCGNVCVGPAELVVSGAHAVEVAS